ncbi:FAD binding domain-containing protein [Aspergillus pseudonomiae]|uniref:FAD binding domain-containing protein n=1 Tax=Aspergillus pseudonomiae TaxID=1506151 RepID=A0A5N7CTC6_9EURO|nr:FAD binding domain-containing protein [Aspergillus pseudonomiae]KAE8397456.1 FAD binding domain-containing protein [Aspergillus pseudonomiae]
MSDNILWDLPALRATVTPDCEILHDPQDPRFHERLRRWTGIDRRTPHCYYPPPSSIPFVTTCGGHSAWSTIGVEGIIIGLSTKTATLVGGVLSKQVGMRLAKAGLFTALGNGNMVGAIPYFLGGGVSITSSITGFGSDQIVSARLITAKDGEKLIEFFGLVTELTIRAHPLSLLRRQKGLIWIGAFIFPLERATEVAPVMKRLMADAQYEVAGLMMISTPPPTRTPYLVIAARYTGAEEPQVPFKALYDLHPMVVTGGDVPIQNTSDAREVLCAKGDFKQFGVVGLHEFNADGLVRTIDTWKQMVHDCPDAIKTGFNFQWDSRPVKTPEVESAMSLHDIRYWQNNLIWHTEVRNSGKVGAYNNECISIMRGVDQSHFRPYRGQVRLEKLRRLKIEWDAQGAFTRQMLD